jgi:predicted transcriptional regulator of viral defense system
MNMQDILSRLRKSGLAVFTINDLKKLTGLKRESVYVYLSRMLKKGYAYKIEKGKFTIYEDPFLVSTQLISPSYISFLSALYLHGKTTQTINEVQVVTSRRKKEIEVFNTRIKFIQLNPKFMFGFKKVSKGNSFIFLADLEKAIIDSLYLPRYCPISEVWEAIKEADKEKLVSYASKLKIEAINRRLGYLLSLLGIKTNLKAKTKIVYKLNPAIKSRGKFNSEWRLYINEVLA